MNFNDNLPIYIQIMNLIKEDIILGNISSGDKIESVRDMSKKYKVNPNTVSRAFLELEREELLYKERGMGTFLTRDVSQIENLKNERAKHILDRFIDEISSFNYSREEIIKMIESRLEGYGNGEYN